MGEVTPVGKGKMENKQEENKQEETKNGFHYDAFISYRHLDPDQFAAEKLHKKLESFRLMSSVAKKHPELPKKIHRVFRDQEELPLASNLADPITEALKNSDNLIVICTPKLKESRWCLQEIDTFIKYHGREHIFTALVEGEPSESFPEALLHDENGNPVEPLAADFRGANHKEIAKKIDAEVLRLIAPMFGLNYDELKQRHREQKLRRTFALGGILLALSTAMGIYYGITAYHIKQQADKIVEQNGQILEQNDQIVAMADQIKEQYVQSLKKYEITVAGTIEKMMQDGRRNDSLAVLTAAMPDKKEGEEIPYCSNAEYMLGQVCHVYGDGSAYTPTMNYEGEAPLMDVLVSPGGDKVAAVSRNGILYVWKSEDATPVAEIDLAYGTKRQYTFISDTEMLMMEDGSFVLLNLDTMERTILVEGTMLGNLTWNSDKTVVVADMSDSLAFYDVAAKKLISTVEKEKEEKSDTLSRTAVNEDGTVYFAAEYEYSESGEVVSITARDVATGDVISKISFPKGTGIHGLCSVGNTLYITGYTQTSEENRTVFDGFFKKFDYVEGRIVLDVPFVETSLENLLYSNIDGQEYIIGSTYDMVYALDAKTGGVIFVNSFADKIVKLLPSTSGTLVGVISQNGEFQFLNVELNVIFEYYTFNFESAGVISGVAVKGSKMYVCKNNESFLTGYERVLAENMDKVADDVKYDYMFGSGKTILKNDYSAEGSYTAYRVEDMSALYTVPVGDGNIELIRGGNDGILVYDRGTGEGNYKVYDSNTGKEVSAGTAENIREVNAYGNILIYRESNTEMGGVDVITGKKVSVEIPESYILLSSETDIASDLSGMVSVYDNSLHVFSLNNSSAEKSVPLKNGLLSRVFYSEDSKYICVVYNNDFLEILDASTLELKRTIYGDDYDIQQMFYIEDKQDYLLKGYHAILLNSDLEKIAYLRNCRGYDSVDRKLSFYYMNTVYRSDILDYEDIVGRAKKILGDYKAPDWIYQRYSISSEQ